jgi:hypothetical protein
MKGDVKNKLLPQRRQDFLEIQPPTWHPRVSVASGPRSNRNRSRLAACESFGFHLSFIHCVAEGLRTSQAVGVVLATRVLSETRGLWLYWVIRGAYSLSRDSGPYGHRPNRRADTLPRTRTSEEFTEDDASRKTGPIRC